METYNIHYALVQEPHSYRSSLPGYPSIYRHFYDSNSDIIKAAIIVRTCHLSTFLDYKNTDYNIDFKSYRRHNCVYSFSLIILNLQKTLTRIFIKSAKFLVAKVSIDWFGVWTPIANLNNGLVPIQMYEEICEFISANNIYIINGDCGSNFRATRGTSYIDVTVVGSDLLQDNSS
ncbi:hypothetical protein TNIN_425241 [Trichonephila inaurata madagascariensis]|uniref:Uncharacterized protein n=1 Tax=Trichonephila inaurata madagascariensis TaxID=2747483 RepID=A0A8X6XFL8_9ARAC|nr:hypothetical protein TNIN_425241 [Trichonephila inaurata madagascariensis]